MQVPRKNVVGSEVLATEILLNDVMSYLISDVSCCEVAITAGGYFRYRPCGGGNA